MADPVTLVGLDELQKKLEGLARKATGRVSQKVARAGATPLRKSMKRHARRKTESSTGDLARSIKTFLRRLDFGYFAVTGVDNNYQGGPVKAGDGSRGGTSHLRINVPRNYAHLVEWGFVHADGYWVPPKSFVRRAFDETTSAVLAAMRKKWAEEIEKEAAKND